MDKDRRTLRWFLTGNGARPFASFRTSWRRKLFLALFTFLVVMVTLHVSFRIALGNYREGEHQMDLATASMMQGRYSDALEHYDLAISRNNRKRQAWIGKGLALMYLKRYDESLVNYEHLLRIDPENVYGWQGKAMSLGYLGHFDEAIVSFDHALEIQPDYGLIRDQLDHMKELQKQ
jgi:tetratricopeptide (TPR) repeat protein